MYDEIVLSLSIEDIGNSTASIGKRSLVTHLSTTFGIERRSVEHQLVVCAVLLAFHFAIFHQAHHCLKGIIADKFLFIVIVEHHPIVCLHLGCRARTLFLLLQMLLKSCLIKG